ncbi:hypothetical protein CGC55_06190 [Capnocytophaga sputigena]|uniref:Uncharacterized protein n=1 Tax=Capnocytophaga sputigena TaxID=1019 RepID=A0ABN5BJL8_CAPSP|nr:hypothetical protein CGC55_06190 [Capnocytophaga sputigena]
MDYIFWQRYEIITNYEIRMTKYEGEMGAVGTVGAVGAVGGDGREYLGGTLKVSEGGGSNGSNGREETPMDCTDKTDFDAF